MADFLNLGLLKSFEVIFSFLFVFIVSYAVLSKINFPKDSQSLQSLMAFVLAVFVSLSGNVGKLIATMAPWFIIMFLIIMFMLIGNMMFGMDEAHIKNYIQNNSTITTWIIIISFLIVFISASTIYGGTFLSFTQNKSIDMSTSNADTATSSVTHNIGATIFHPKVLGLIFVSLVGVFAILLLTKSPDIPIK